MPQVSDFYLDFNVTGSERKRLVHAISEYVGEDPRYLGAPSFAYQVDYFTIDKKGVVSFDDRADSTEIEGLIETLANQGFVSVGSNFTPQEEASLEEAAQADENVEVTEVAEMPQLPTENAATEAETATEAIEPDRAVEKTPPPSESEASGIPGLPPEILARLDSLRGSLIREVNRQFNEFLRGDSIPASRGRTRPARRTTEQLIAPGETASVPLCGDISSLRGTKPVLVQYNDTAISATSWKQVAAAILDICNRQEVYHQALLQARETLAGRGRKLVADSPQGMYSPLMVDEGLYVETNFSTEALLKFLRDRILKEIGFDGSGITLEYRRP